MISKAVCEPPGIMRVHLWNLIIT